MSGISVSHFVFVAALAGVAACSGPKAEPAANKTVSGADAPVAAINADAPANPVAAALPAAETADGKERFYGKERFTLVMTHSGSQTGTTTTHVRDWGRLRAEINDHSLSVAGMVQPTRNRIVFEGARATTIDAASNAATALDNPFYDQVVAAMRGRTGVEFGEQIMAQLGGRATGEKGSFAGEPCDYWEIAAVGSRSCVTPWGATLHLKTSFGGITLEQTATDLRVGDGGPDTAFAFDAASVTEAPDLTDLMSKLNRN